MKKLLFVILILTIFVTGCTFNNRRDTNNGENEVDTLSFDNDIASGISRNYMSAMAIGDMKGMRELASADLAKGLTLQPDNTFKITGIRLEETSQKGLNAVYKYTVSKGKIGEPVASLEHYYVKVKKDNDEYKVSSVKSVLLYEVFKVEKHLKIRTDDNVEVNNITKLKNLPNLVYPKQNKGDIAKISVPKDDYGSIGISFTGHKVGISTTKENDTYVCIIEIDDAIPTDTKGGNIDKNENKESNNIEDLLEDEDKLVGKKIVTLDVYSNVKVTSLMFTSDDTHIAVNYNKGGVNRFDFFESNGDLIDLKLKNIFAEDKYHLMFRDYKDQEIFFSIEGVKDADGVDQSLIGSYKISIKDFKLTKL